MLFFDGLDVGSTLMIKSSLSKATATQILFLDIPLKFLPFLVTVCDFITGKIFHQNKCFLLK